MKAFLIGLLIYLLIGIIISLIWVYCVSIVEKNRSNIRFKDKSFYQDILIVMLLWIINIPFGIFHIIKNKDRLINDTDNFFIEFFEDDLE